MSEFTHLHLHTEFSLLDGLNKIKKLADRIKELGMKSVAMTDHGNMYGAVDFYVAMLERGIKPIIGMEAYLHNGDELDDKSTKQRFHLCLYAKDYEGYKNLMYLSSQAFINGFYYYPRINKKLLREHSRGLVCSAACLQGEVNWHLNTQNERNVKFGAKGYEVAKEVALEYKDIFGDDFYLEIMRHGIGDQLFIDDQILKLSKETGIKIVATNDTHYTFKEDAEAQNIAFKILMGATKGLKHIVSEFYVKSPEQMAKVFLDIPEAIANTQEIADKCNLVLPLKNLTITNKYTGEKVLGYAPATPPSFKNTKLYAQNEGLDKIQNLDSINDAWYFEYKCKEGLKERLKNIPESKHQQYWERLQTEIDVINRMNFPGYMLIVWDFINFAKKNGIAVGPGRGSAAGSLVAYSLKITNVDPIKYDLLFERFLNPERVSMPDIDTDFCQKRRGEMIDYMVETYGRYNVAQVITYNSLKAKGVIRDVARALEFPLKDADALAKLIPDKKIKVPNSDKEVEPTLENSLKYEPKIAEFLAVTQGAQEVWDKALTLEGLNRNAGVHAAAIVIDSTEELWHKAPLFAKDGTGVTTQYNMKWLEAVDLIKFDFLGLKTLDVIDDALKLIKKRYGVDVDFETMDMNDPKVFEMIQKGDTAAVFQMESTGMQAACRRILPSNFEDIVAIIAIYRPGPMDNINDFADRKHGLQKIDYIFKELEPVLSPTYGVIVYQEQIMKIVQVVAGFSLAKADLVRRAMGKKQLEEMQKLKGEFADGAQANGFDRAKAEELWELILKFANYGFNRSHAVAYGFVAYQTAYLKVHYQHEFMAAMLTSESRKVESIAKYITDAKAMKLEILPANVNHSSSDFGVIGENASDKKIVFGLSAIKGVGEFVIDDILAVREKGGAFKDLADFVGRVTWTTESNQSIMSKKALEPLIKSGSLDGLGFSRKAMMDNIEKICEAGRNKDQNQKMFASSLFSMMGEDLSNDVKLDFKDCPEFSIDKLLEYEFECLGIYVSGNPLDEFRERIEKVKGRISVSDIDDYEIGSMCMIVGNVMDLKHKISKKGSAYGSARFVDFGGNCQLMFFETHLRKLESLLESGEPIALKCKIEDRDEKKEFRVMDIFDLEEGAQQKVRLKKSDDSEHISESSAIGGAGFGGVGSVGLSGARGFGGVSGANGVNGASGSNGAFRKADSENGTSFGGVGGLNGSSGAGGADYGRGDAYSGGEFGLSDSENFENDDFIPINLVPDELDFCTPLTLIVDESDGLSVLENLKAAAHAYAGRRELRVVINNSESKFTFISNLSVNSAIKQKFQNLKWSE